jgi:hypothetical protein
MAVFKQRRGTAAALAAANETPAAGQIVVETDTSRLKVGDGVTQWNSLGYINNDIAIADVTGLTAALAGKQEAGEYATISHTHTISAVVGLQSALDGTAPLVHTHTVSAITDAGTAATRDVPATGNATSTQVVIGSDTRLTDPRTPSDGSVTAAKLSSTLVIDCGSV